MTADNITLQRLSDLLALIDIAHLSVANLEQDARDGFLDPNEAAMIIDDMMTNLNAATR